jgi:hypothetical protein
MKEYVHHFIVFAYYPNFNCNPSNKSPIVQLRCRRNGKCPQEIGESAEEASEPENV